MSKPIEATARGEAFVHDIDPYWADADPAGIVYTGRFTDYALRAIDAWMEARAGAGFYRMNTEWGVGTPFVHTECDLRSPAKPGERLRVTVEIARVGATSLTFAVRGHGVRENQLRFEGRFVCVCVRASDQASEPRSIELDPRLRRAAEADAERRGD
jgi:acyl-CoA thioesterase FadM